MSLLARRVGLTQGMLAEGHWTWFAVMPVGMPRVRELTERGIDRERLRQGGGGHGLPAPSRSYL